MPMNTASPTTTIKERIFQPSPGTMMNGSRVRNKNPTNQAIILLRLNEGAVNESAQMTNPVSSKK